MKKLTFAIPILLLLLALSPATAGCDYITGEAVKSPLTPQPPAVVKNVTPEEAYQLLRLSSKRFQVLDVRTPQEYAEGHLAGAKNIDFTAADFKEKAAELDKNTPYIVYCRTGSRSAAASQVMAELGFREIYNMTGGFTDWQAAGFPVVK